MKPLEAATVAEPRFLTSHEVASLVRVSPSAVLRWIDQGLLKAFRTPGGHRRVTAHSLRSFLRSHQMPVPASLEQSAARILVIDDEPAFLRSVATVIRHTDVRAQVELCESPVSGLLKVGLWRPDVVLLDAYMPHMDGPEVCQRLKADPETAGIAVLAMSGRPSPELQATFRKAGAAGFLSKPVTSAALVGALTDLGVVSPSS